VTAGGRPAGRPTALVAELIAVVGAVGVALAFLLPEADVVVEKPWLLDPLTGASYNARLDVHEELALTGQVVAGATEESVETIEDIQGYGRRRMVQRPAASRDAEGSDDSGVTGIKAAERRKWEVVRDGYTITLSGALPSGRQIALSLTPAVHPDAPYGNIRWACGHDRPAGWIELGAIGVTTVPQELLIRPCRAREERNP